MFVTTLFPSSPRPTAAVALLAAPRPVPPSPPRRLSLREPACRPGPRAARRRNPSCRRSRQRPVVAGGDAELGRAVVARTAASGRCRRLAVAGAGHHVGARPRPRWESRRARLGAGVVGQRHLRPRVRIRAGSSTPGSSPQAPRPCSAARRRRSSTSPSSGEDHPGSPSSPRCPCRPRCVLASPLASSAGPRRPGLLGVAPGASSSVGGSSVEGSSVEAPRAAAPRVSRSSVAGSLSGRLLLWLSLSPLRGRAPRPRRATPPGVADQRSVAAAPPRSHGAALRRS